MQRSRKQEFVERLSFLVSLSLLLFAIGCASPKNSSCGYCTVPSEEEYADMVKIVKKNNLDRLRGVYPKYEHLERYLGKIDRDCAVLEVE